MCKEGLPEEKLGGSMDMVDASEEDEEECLVNKEERPPTIGLVI